MEIPEILEEREADLVQCDKQIVASKQRIKLEQDRLGQLGASKLQIMGMITQLHELMPEDDEELTNGKKVGNGTSENA